MNLIPYLWAGLLVVFLVVEAACPIHLVSIWFAVGSLAALIASWLSAPLWLQILLFVLVSGGLLLALWPLTKKYINPSHTATNLDSVIGAQGYVTADIENVHAQGQVKINGMEWTARSTHGDPIPQGTLVKVDRIEGVKVFVSPAAVSVK